MRALLQRVAEAAVNINGHERARIGPGLLVLLGIAAGDDDTCVRRLARKTAGLRIFPDAHKPMNLSVQDSGGGILVVSQFTLAADTSKGMRPGFATAAAPDRARELYQAYVRELVALLGREVATGEFGADMQVSLVNDGPVSFVLDQTPVV